MRFLHTSDLHLGLRLCERPMNEDIAHLLNEIVEIAKRENCAAVIVAGDIYDRSNPGAESVAIFDKFVTDLAGEGIAALAVSGNHDSPERVAYMSTLLGNMGVHFTPVYDGRVTPVILFDEYGEVNFWLLPFLRPSTVRAIFPEFDGDTYTDAIRFAVGQMNVNTNERNVLVTHQYVVGTGNGCEEMVGGITAIDCSVFADFNYTALGHLHSPHYAGADSVRYSGSPLKCSFSEVDDEKTVDLVEIGEGGRLSVKQILLHPIHDMREIRGLYDEIMSLQCRERVNAEDYIRIVLTDDEDIPDVVAKLRTAYPNLLRLAYDNKRTREYRTVENTAREDLDALLPEDVFAELYEIQNNEPPTDEEMAIVRKLLREIQSEENV